MASRPANSGGLLPALGAKGFLTKSIRVFLLSLDV
jgi:hypothetical protein